MVGINTNADCSASVFCLSPVQNWGFLTILSQLGQFLHFMGSFFMVFSDSSCKLTKKEIWIKLKNMFHHVWKSETTRADYCYTTNWENTPALSTKASSRLGLMNRKLRWIKSRKQKRAFISWPVLIQSQRIEGVPGTCNDSSSKYIAPWVNKTPWYF